MIIKEAEKRTGEGKQIARKKKKWLKRKMLEEI